MKSEAKRKINIVKILFVILSIILIANNIYLLINIKGLHNIENMIRLVASIIIVLCTLLIVFLNIKAVMKKKKWLYVVLAIINLIFIGIIGFLNINFKNVKLGNVF